MKEQPLSRCVDREIELARLEIFDVLEPAIELLLELVFRKFQLGQLRADPADFGGTGLLLVNCFGEPAIKRAAVVPGKSDGHERKQEDREVQPERWPGKAPPVGCAGPVGFSSFRHSVELRLDSSRFAQTSADRTIEKFLINTLKAKHIRVALFVDPVVKMVRGAAEVGADRIELYTGNFALAYKTDPGGAVSPHTQAAEAAQDAGLGINAGHDLNLENLEYYRRFVPGLLEVSIGHALISDALYYGLQNTIGMYRRCLA
jgi:hypothetical protein